MATYRTALVTGASSGIGEAMARELARRGSDLVLVARRRPLLERLAAEVGGEHGVAVEVLPADLTADRDVGTVAARAADVDLLVNNAGVSTTGRFSDRPVERAEAQVRLNVLAVVRLAHAALGGMVARGSGGVLNVSSVAGFQPLPGSATYAASKAFVTTFTESLAGEVPGSVHVTALCPGFVRTDFIRGLPLPGALLLDPADVARAGLDGVERGSVVVVPSLRYQGIALLGRYTPRSVLRVATRAFGTLS